jgi:hypothetical protein
MVHNGVCRDAIQPGGNASTGLERVQFYTGLQEDFLQEIVHRIVLTDAFCYVAAQAGAVLGQEVMNDCRHD